MFQNCWPTTLEGQILNLSRYFQVLRSPTPEQKVRHPGWRKYCTCLAARWHHGQVTSKDARLLPLLRFLWACRRIVICILWSRILFRKTSVNWICSLQTNGTVLIQVLILWVSKFQVQEAYQGRNTDSHLKSVNSGLWKSQRKAWEGRLPWSYKGPVHKNPWWIFRSGIMWGSGVFCERSRRAMLRTGQVLPTWKSEKCWLVALVVEESAKIWPWLMDCGSTERLHCTDIPRCHCQGEEHREKGNEFFKETTGGTCGALANDKDGGFPWISHSILLGQPCFAKLF